MEFKNIITALGILITLGIGIYNIFRSRSIQNMVDSLLLDEIRFEAVQIAIDTAAIREKTLNSLQTQLFKLKISLAKLTTKDGKNLVQQSIHCVEERIEGVKKCLEADREFIESSDELTAETNPNPELIKLIKRSTGEIKARYCKANLQNVNVNGLISDSENTLIIAK